MVEYIARGVGEAQLWWIT